MDVQAATSAMLQQHLLILRLLSFNAAFVIQHGEVKMKQSSESALAGTKRTPLIMVVCTLDVWVLLRHAEW